MSSGVFSRIEDSSNLTDEDYIYIQANIRHKFVNFEGYKKYDKEFRDINLDFWDEKSKLILAASIMQWDDIDNFTNIYPNLESLKNIKPLKENWVLNENPIFVGKGFKYYGVTV